MTIIICPTEKCNFKCSYCFEPDDQRKGLDIPFNMQAMKRSIAEVWKGPFQGSDLCLHGGESTLIDRDKLEAIMDFLYGFKGNVNIVTNGSTIDDHMIQLFKKYNVHIGVSCDGPPELNVLRGPDPSNPETTRKYNEKLNYALLKLKQEKLPTSIMCILHTENAGTEDKLDLLKKWMLGLKTLGITGGRLNLMYGNKRFELSPSRASEVWVQLYEHNKKHGLNWNPFKEMEGNLKGEKLKPCVFNRCDMFSTRTLSIHPDGGIGNCDRTFSNGIYLRSRSPMKSGRYESLIQNQCKGCRFWEICGGGCPMEGVGDDWRNKTRLCKPIYDLYSHIEKTLKTENLSINLVTDGIQEKRVETWNIPHGDQGHGDESHGDLPHGDSGHGDAPHGNMGHGDIPHGDSSHPDAPDWTLDPDSLEWRKP